MHGFSEDVVVALPDGELVRLIYEHVRQVPDDEEDGDSGTRDALHWLVTELIERFAPELEWAEHVRYYREDYEEGDNARVTMLDELAAARRGMRRRQGARMIRRALEEA